MATMAPPLNVLIAEDDDVGRAALEKAVRSLGHHCRSAADGLEAWEMHQAERADVIVTDWKMPRMDGIELCRRTREADADDAYTYFIFLTAFDDKEHLLRAMQVGADDYQSKPVDIDELHARLVSASRVLAAYRKIAQRATQHRRDSQRFFRIARVDPLTGVGNRLALDEDLAGVFPHVKRYGNAYAIAICDVDEFKKYNDAYGHLAGDDVLRKVATEIRMQLRESDGVYRYGGDEFVVVLPEQSLLEATRAMERVRAAVEGLAIPTVGPRGVVTVSIGIAAIDRTPAENLSAWLRRADEALYRAKSVGRNRSEAAG
jgi:diguanylate cyclase (GGDEF)-like protein